MKVDKLTNNFQYANQSVDPLDKDEYYNIDKKDPVARRAVRYGKEILNKDLATL